MQFKGPPGSLVAGVQLPRAHRTRRSIRVGEQSYRLSPSGAAEVTTRLSFSMPADTPPGKYDAIVSLGGEALNAVVEVAARRNVQVEPHALSLEAAAGQSVRARLELHNGGNVPLEAPPAQVTLTLRTAGALARGVRAAFEDPDRDIATRLIKLGERLSVEPVVEVVVSSEGNFESLAAGEDGSVDVSMQIPEGMARDQPWAGQLSLPGVTVPVALHVDGP